MGASHVSQQASVRGAAQSPVPDSFWRASTFAELQAQQGTTGRLDPAALVIEGLTDDERAAFLAALDGS